MLFHGLHGFGQGDALDEDVAVDVGDAVDTFAREAAALQAEAVHAAVLDGVAGGLDEGRDVLVDEGAALGDDVRADVDEL